MSGPQNAVFGDDSFGTDLPETQVDTQAIEEEQRKAQYTKSKDWDTLKAYLETRIEHYQRFLPGNIPVEHVPEEERAKYWAVSNMVISELKSIIASYENAFEALKEDEAGL